MQTKRVTVVRNLSTLAWECNSELRHTGILRDLEEAIGKRDEPVWLPPADIRFSFFLMSITGLILLSIAADFDITISLSLMLLGIVPFAINRAFSPSLRIVAFLLSLAGIMLLAARMAFGAPAPFPKATRPQPVALSLRSLSGQWVLYWGGAPYKVTIGRDGSWRAVGSSVAAISTTWTGTVQIQRGKLWLVENADPANPHGWSSYCLDLDPVTLRGKVIEGCEEQTTVVLRRPGAEPLTMPRAEE